jgi:hypothetical protein
MRGSGARRAPTVADATSGSSPECADWEDEPTTLRAVRPKECQPVARPSAVPSKGSDGGPSAEADAAPRSRPERAAWEDEPTTLPAPRPKECQPVARQSAAPSKGSSGVPSGEAVDLDQWLQSSMRPPAFRSPDSAWPEAVSLRHPERASRRRVGWFLVAISVTLGVLILGVAVLRVFATRKDSPAPADKTERLDRATSPGPVASSSNAPASRSDVAAEPTEAGSPSRSPASLAPIPESPASSTQGDVRLPSSALDHRVYVDGHLVRATSSRVRLQCGLHTVRVGSKGGEQSVDVPCGSSVGL